MSLIGSRDRDEHDCLIFSLEMSKDQLMQRAAAMEARIDLMRLRMMRLNPDDADRYMAALGTLAALPIAVDDTPGATVAAMRASASRHQAERGRPLVLFVDYIGLVAAPGFKACRAGRGRIEHQPRSEDPGA
jgi:replicative DNA helicase